MKFVFSITLSLKSAACPFLSEVLSTVCGSEIAGRDNEAKPDETYNVLLTLLHFEGWFKGSSRTVICFSLTTSVITEGFIKTLLFCSIQKTPS